MNYLEATAAGQGATIHGQWVARARFGNHLRLAILVKEFKEALIARDAGSMSQAISAYFSLAGLDPTGLTGVEQMGAFGALISLNTIKWLLPFQEWQQTVEDDELTPVPYHYEGRGWAWHVHRLATRYGWTPTQIFELWPEEVAAYMQEIMVSEFDEWDRSRSLSELGYKIDKTTKEASFHPTPRPGWMVPPPKETIFRIKRSMIPLGNVVKLEDMAHEINI